MARKTRESLGWFFKYSWFVVKIKFSTHSLLKCTFILPRKMSQNQSFSWFLFNKAESIYYWLKCIMKKFVE